MIEFAVLGPVAVRINNIEVELPQGLPRLLLALLLCRAGNSFDLEAIADALWNGRPPRTARKAIHVYVYHLRRALRDDRRIRHTSGGYTLVVGPGELDSERFETWVLDAAKARAAGDRSLARDTWDKALGLWRGNAYSDSDDLFHVTDERERLQEIRLTALEEHVALELELRVTTASISDLARLAAGYPYRERLRGLQMLALYRCGRQVEAFEVFRTLRRQLVAE